jgi:hypothetical protein
MVSAYPEFRLKSFIALFTQMAFFRQYIAPFLIVLVFLVALAATSARIFLPSDLAAPAPTETVTSNQ